MTNVEHFEPLNKAWQYGQRRHDSIFFQLDSFKCRVIYSHNKPDNKCILMIVHASTFGLYKVGWGVNVSYLQSNLNMFLLVFRRVE